MKSSGDAEQLTLWPEVFPASRTALQVAARAARTSVTCDPSSHAWCERFDRTGCSLRTFLASALQRQTKCLATWSKRATPHGRLWWVLTMLARLTGASASGSWATPVTGDAKQVAYRRDRGTKGLERPALLAQARGDTWATPSARDWRSGLASEATHTKNSRPLNEQATRENWPTPNATDHRGASQPPGRRPACDDDLPSRVIRHESAAGQPDPESSSANGRRRDWRTPSASVMEPKPPGTKLTGRTPQDPQVGLADQANGSLNPAWVAQLMGFPDGWLPVTAALLSTLSGTRSARRSRKS